MNAIAQLEFELAFFKSVIQYFIHYTSETPPYLFSQYYGLK